MCVWLFNRTRFINLQWWILNTIRPCKMFFAKCFLQNVLCKMFFAVLCKMKIYTVLEIIIWKFLWRVITKRDQSEPKPQTYEHVQVKRVKIKHTKGILHLCTSFLEIFDKPERSHLYFIFEPWARKICSRRNQLW